MGVVAWDLPQGCPSRGRVLAIVLAGLLGVGVVLAIVAALVGAARPDAVTIRSPAAQAAPGSVPAATSTGTPVPSGLHMAIEQALGIGAQPAGGPALSPTYGAGGSMTVVAPGSATATWTLRPTGFGRGTLSTVSGGAPATEGTKHVDDLGPLDVWYRSGTGGIEQGFTVPSRPAGTGTSVTIAMASAGSLTPVATGPTSISLQDAGGTPVLRYDDLRVTDASGRVLPSHLAVVAGQVRIVFDDQGATYPVTVDPWAKTTGPASTGDAFGYTVDLSGNGSTALVTYYSGGRAEVEGYTKKETGTKWNAGSPLTAKGTGTNFGSTLALTTNGTTALVGDQGTSSGAGSVFWYTRSGTTWTYGGKLTHPSTAKSFGISVSLSGSGDTALIGASTTGSNTAPAGAAYVFTYATSWGTGTALPVPATAYEFGASVSLLTNGEEALVGTDNATHTTVGPEKVIDLPIYEEATGTWSAQGSLAPPAGSTSFGEVVALAGGGDAALVGGTNSNTTDVVTAYGRTAGTWGTGKTLTRPAGSVEFGESLALSSSGTTALVGDPDAGIYHGTATVYTHSVGGWSGPTSLSRPTGAYNFGTSVALSATGTTALVGASGTGTVAPDGAAYVFTTTVPTPVATKVVVTTQPPTSVKAGTGFGLTVKVESSSGTVVTSSATVTAALAANMAGGTLTGTTTATASGGVATFSDLVIDKAGTGYTLKLTSGSLTTTTTSAFAVDPAAAHKLVVTAQPPTPVTAGADFGPTVTIEDPYGNVVTSTTTATVTAVLTAHPAGSTLTGTTATASHGVATFDALVIDKAGTGYTLKLTSGSLTSATTSAFTVVPAAAHKLVVTAQPPTPVTAGADFGPTVTIEDTYGNKVTSSATVTAALAANMAGGTLTGTTTATASGGVATFGGLVIDKAGTGYTLKLTSGSLTTTTTSAFAVDPAAAHKLVVTAQPPTPVTAGADFGPTVTIEDTYGNKVTSSATVTAALAANMVGGTLTGTTTATASGGVATFGGLVIDKAGTGYTLKLTSGSLTTTTTSAFAVDPAAAHKLVVTAQPPTPVTAGADFGPTVTIEDPYGNVVTSTTTATVTAALTAHPAGGTLTGTTTATASGGVATFGDLVIDKAGTGYTLKLTSGSLTTTTTSAFAVDPAAAHKLVVTAQPPTPVTAGADFGPTVTIEDTYGNKVTSSATVTAALAANMAGGTLTGTTTATASGGVATFGDLVIDKAGTGYTLKLTSGSLTTTTTSAFTVDPAAAHKLVVTAQPPTPVTAGADFGPTVTIEDTYGNKVTSSATVTAALAANMAGGTLTGTTTATASGGVATFGDLVIDKAGTGYTLKLTSGSLTTTTTSAFTVVPATATATTSTITADPTSITANGATTSTITVQAKDAYGNDLTTGTAAVTLTTTDGTLGPVTDDHDGTYTATLTAPTTVGSATVTGTINTVAIGHPATVDFTPGSATHLSVVATPTATAAGSPISVTVTAYDAHGNVATGYTGTVHFTSTDPQAILPTNSTLTTGTKTFTTGVTLKTAGTQTVTATDTATSSITGVSGTVTVTPATGTAATSTITADPASIKANGATTSTITVQVKDAYGNDLTTGTATVTLTTTDGTLTGVTDPTNGTYTATLTAPTTVGSATLTGTINTVAIGHPATVDFTPGSATHLSVVATPTATAAGSPISVTVTAYDAHGNVATGYTGTVHFTSTDPQAILPTNSTLTTGTKTFTTGVTLKTAGTQTVTATDTATSSITGVSGTVTVTPATATQLVVSTQPPTPVTAGADFGPTVTIEDTYGNKVTSSATVTAALAANMAGGTLTGTTTATASGGVATFGDLVIDKAGTGYTLKLTSGSLTTTTTSAFTVVPATATATTSTITADPTSITANGATTSTITVQAKDAYGNDLTTGTAAVTLTTTDGTLGPVTDDHDGTYTATLTAPTTVGSATVTGTINTVAIGHPATVDFTPGSATHLSVVATPTATAAGSPISVTVTAYDAHGNVATGYTGTVHFTSTDPQAILPTNSTLTTGTKTFTTGVTLKTAGTQTVTATDTATSSITGVSGTVTVTPATATQLAVTTQPTTPVTAGAGFGPTVTIEDPYGNVVTSTTTATVTAVLTAHPAGGTLTGTTTATASGGVATFSDLVIDKAGIGYTLKLTSGSLTTTTTSAFAVDPAAAHKLVVTAQPPTPVTAGADFGPTVTIEDTYGNKVTSSATVTAALAANMAGGTLTGTTTATASGGVATFGDLVIDKAGTGYTLKLTSGSLTTTTTSAFTVVPATATATTSTITADPTSITANGATTSTITVQAKDAYGNDLTTGTAAVTLTTTDGTLGPVTDDHDGTYTATLTAPTTVGSATVTGTINTVAIGHPATVDFTPGSATHLSVVATPTATAAGSPISVTVTAYDAHGNVATGYTGTVHFTSTDPQAILPTNSTLTTGTKTFTTGVTLKTAGTQTVTATDTATSSITGVSGTVTVTPATGTAATSTITADPASIKANGATTSTITVQVKDAYGNDLTTGTATVTLTTTDGTLTGVTDPTNGTYTATLTAPTTVGSATLTGTINTVAIGHPATVDFTPGSATHLSVVATPTATAAGSPISVTVTAYDAHGNVATGYTGTVHFTSTDPQAILPADYAFTGGDAGVHTFTAGVTLTTPGEQTVTATDTVTASITGTSGTVTVGSVPGAPTGLVASSTPGVVHLTWTAPSSDGNSAVTGYQVFRGTSAGGEGATPLATVSAGTAYADTTAISGATYYYEVTAVNAFGSSARSNEASVQVTAPLTAGASVAATPDGQGYWISRPDGSVQAFGDAQLYGSMAGQRLNQPIVGITGTRDGHGYWLVAADGGVFAFGDAAFYGSTGNIHLNQPIVGMAATPDGQGYWLVASDGGVFAFGDAAFYGSTGDIHLNQPVVGMAATPDGQGYWLVASDGGVFAFGDAAFYGSMGGQPLNQPIVGITGTRDGHGYWLVAADGGVFCFGDAAFYGSTANDPGVQPTIGLIAAPDGLGYSIIDAAGGATKFGS